jgi:hypothetical protein
MRQFAAQYLVIPSDYGIALDRMRWSTSGDVLLVGEGQTFAFAQQLWPFFEGFMAVRPPLHFAHMLHLVHLMGLGSINKIDEGTVELRRAVLQAGRPMRNAGVFAAHLCRELPSTIVALDPLDLRQELYHRTFTRVSAVEIPPLTPDEIRRHVVRELVHFTPAEMLHWLKFGQAPQRVAERLAEEIERRPPNVEAALARAAENRERLTGALALIPALNGALTLPPRRLDEHELPVGGYADVTTRGEPERLLPTQFALESDEFIRRFAEHELLFFRREEPGHPTQEELVVLLDQGIRTWGAVRLALAGAVFAFARHARRRGIPLRLATTSNKGRLIDPLMASAESLGAVLEASDLTANPIESLTAVLDAPCERLRDVVLLTHPRSLTDEPFAAVAGRERETDRLFAVSVDSEGRGRLDRLREGRPVALSRFRLDLASMPAPPATPKPAANADPYAWTGDVEPVPFPFWFGPLKAVEHVAFDHDSEWLLVVTAQGLLHARSFTNSRQDVLPRGYLRNQVLREVDAVLGVAGGFVVCGKLLQSEERGGRETINLRPVAFHYDMKSRRVSAHTMPEREPQSADWFAFPDLHAIACKTARETWGLDLATGAGFPAPGADRASRAGRAVERARQRSAAAPHVIAEGDTQGEDTWYHFDHQRGEVSVFSPDGVEAEQLCPLRDGRPALVDAELDGVQMAGDIVAVLAAAGEGSRLYVLRCRDGGTVREFDMPERDGVFRLSDDGVLIARHARRNEVMIHDTRDGVPRGVMFAGRCHTNIEVELGADWLAVRIGELGHLFRWRSDELQHLTPANEHYLDAMLAVGVTTTGSKPAELSPLTRYDWGRFLKRAAGRLRVEVDRFGHVVVLDAAGERLVAVFWFRRDKAAAWLPDGTRWGAPEIIGTPSPDAGARVARALRNV